MRRTQCLFKKGWTNSPGRTRRGAKNLAWRPKMSEKTLNEFVPLAMEHPPRRPNGWHPAEFSRLGHTVWPKEVAFYNAGDNFEVTPEMWWRLFEKNSDAPFWTPHHNEQAVVHLMPKVEGDPKTYLPRVDAVLQRHIARFGADHIIYNVVMQARAFGRDFSGCEQIFKAMKAVAPLAPSPSAEAGGETMATTDASALVPNGQTYVNMMLAVRLCDKPKELAEHYFKEGVSTGALQAVMRLDTEFAMWWDQLERLGSFTSSSGHLANKVEGAKPMPRNMWALWGWGRDERKFVSRAQLIRERAADALTAPTRRTALGLYGTVYDSVRRQPWAKYQGLFPWDRSGPKRQGGQAFQRYGVRLSDAPKATFNSVPCDPAY